MATQVRRILFGSSAWVPRPDPPRATMVIVVTVAGFDTTTLISDLASHLANTLSWGVLYESIVPLDSVPIESVDPESLAKKVGAVVVSVDFNQPAPRYAEDGHDDLPDQAMVRVLIEQMVSGRSADRDMLLSRRREIVEALGPVSGVIP